ncbi:MAG: hypothetical protein ACRDD2_10360 [Sarcina sp.]
MANEPNRIKLHFADAVPSFNNPNTNKILTLAIFNIIKPTLPTNKTDINQLIKILEKNL